MSIGGQGREGEREVEIEREEGREEENNIPKNRIAMH